jgi:hypothetical protein
MKVHRWHVFWRIRFKNGTVSPWHDVPRKYCKKIDAHKAVRDLNNYDPMIEYIAVPIGLIPKDGCTFNRIPTEV